MSSNYEYSQGGQQAPQPTQDSSGWQDPDGDDDMPF